MGHAGTWLLRQSDEDKMQPMTRRDDPRAERAGNRVGRCLRPVFCALLLLGLSHGALVAQTPAWPTRTVTVVVGFDVGGVTDIMARFFSKTLSKDLGQPVIVENRAGAAGLIAANYVARSAPDGYTLLFAAAPQMLAAPKLHEAKFDPIADFSAVTSIGANSYVLVIRPSIPAKTIPEFVDYAKAHNVAYGSPGAGSLTHLLSALFASNAGFEGTHVPFKGGDQALIALLGGQIDMYFSPVGNIIPYVGTPQVTLLGVATAQRIAQLPNVPSLGELYPNTVLPSWNGIMAPAKTPNDIIEKLARSLMTSVETPGVADMMTKLGIEPQGWSPEEFAGHLADDGLKFDAAIKAARLK